MLHFQGHCPLVLEVDASLPRFAEQMRIPIIGMPVDRKWWLHHGVDRLPELLLFKDGKFCGQPGKPHADQIPNMFEKCDPDYGDMPWVSR